jgi:ABC-type uncharacterized transport system substrate-binding protein
MVEGGNYWDFYQSLLGLAKALYLIGYVDSNEAPGDQYSVDTEPLWEWLSQHGGDKVEFLADGYYSGEWDANKKMAIKEEITSRAKRGDFDAIISFGTAACLDIITDDITIPIMGYTITDPVSSGITKTPEDSGRDNVHILVNLEQIEKQLKLFYSTFRFKKLGVPLEITEEGQYAMGLITIKNIANEIGFAIEPCYSDIENDDLDISFANLLSCVEDLSKSSDAIYLTINNGMQAKRMGKLLDPILKSKIPSLTQSGAADAASGVLMSITTQDFDAIGTFEAKILKQISEGALPRSLPQIYQAPIILSLNLKMAMEIGWNPPFDLLVAADQLYQSMLTPE